MAYENVGQFGREAMDNTLKSLSAMTRGFQQLAVENGEFCKRSLEQSAQVAERFAQVRSVDKAFELQAEYAKSAYEAWMHQTTKVGELYAEIARETYKPFGRTAYAASDLGEQAARQQG